MAVDKLPDLDCVDIFKLALARIRSDGEGITSTRVTRIRNQQSTASDYYLIRTAPTNKQILSDPKHESQQASLRHYIELKRP